MDSIRDRSIGRQWIGEPLQRREDDALLRGKGRFIDDLATQACLYLCFFRSERSSGRLRNLDVTAASTSPGVALVLTADNLEIAGVPAINHLIPGLRLPGFEILPTKTVGWVGQPIAAVVAETRFAAVDAIESIGLDIDDESALDVGEAPVFTHSWGSDVEHAFKGAAHIASVRIECARMAPAPMEPRIAMADCDECGMLTAWIATQTPHRARSDLSQVLGVSEDRIRVIAPDVGGAFGGKASIYPEDIVVAVAALRLRRPVKWVGTRSEEFLAATQGRGAVLKGELAVTAAGRFTALRARLEFPLGSRLPYSAIVPARNAGRILPGPYLVPEIDISVSGRVQNTAPMGIFRGAGRPEAALLMERLVDLAASMGGFDRLELRRMNMLTPEQLPFRTPTGETIDSGQFPALLKAACEKAGYEQMVMDVRSRRAKGAICGIGIAAYVEPCGQGWESAEICIEPDGSILASTGSSAQGQGRETAFAQIVADVLARDVSDVRVAHGDTATSPLGIGALASRSTAIGGSALVQATDAFCETARKFAASLLQCRFEDVVMTREGFEGGSSGVQVSWEKLGKAAHCEDDKSGFPTGLLTSAVFNSDGEAWSSGCCVAQVSIDHETGQLSVEKLVLVDDAGAVINPTLVAGQLVGGIVQGIGEATKEQLVYDSEGQLITASFMDYALPRAHDIPPIELEELGSPSPCNLLGAKGVGEAGCIGSPAAILNAALDALSPFGISHLDLPLTSEKLWSAMRNAPRARRPVHSKSLKTASVHEGV